MAEPEEVIIDAAQRATVAVGRVWRRHYASRRSVEGAWLADHKERLRLLITALFGSEIHIRTAEPPAPPSFLARLLRRQPRSLVEHRALPGSDGQSVFLPPFLTGYAALPAERVYRVLGLLQAVRAQRLSALGEPLLERERLELDLFLIREAQAAEAAVAREFPGTAGDAAALREGVLEERKSIRGLSAREQAVEQLYLDVLRSPPRVRDIPDIRESLAWAEQQAQGLQTIAGLYRGLLHDLWWGVLYPPRLAPNTGKAPGDDDSDAEMQEQKVGRLRRRPKARDAVEGEDEDPPGAWMVQGDDPHEHAEDPMGLQRPTDRDDSSSPDDLADSLSELDEARLVATPERAKEVLLSDDSPERISTADIARPKATGIVYPEWDYRIGAYHHPGVTVRLKQTEAVDTEWAAQVMDKHRPLLMQVQRQFEKLQPRRVELRAQPDGDDIDLDAYVSAYADMRAGGLLPERLYKTTRPGRRDIAIYLLVDISGSTDSWIEGTQRIIDVEKEALLIVCRALEALGDPYMIEAFSGEGPRNVSVWSLKRFEELDCRLVDDRIAALEPDRYTRAGGAVRHATAQLARRGESQRLLLLLSDGKPNDVDHYEGQYGIEDLRQAVAEATLEGIHCHCLTVDRAAPAYIAKIFGVGRYSVLRNPSRLPAVLVDLLGQLVKV